MVDIRQNLLRNEYVMNAYINKWMNTYININEFKCINKCVDIVIKSTLLLLIQILAIEALLTKTHKDVILPKDVLSSKSRTYVERCYRIIKVFLFGCAATQFLTEIGKYSVGRLRPHFFDVCKPNITTCTSALGYITEVVCQGTDLTKILHARYTFSQL